MLLGVVTGFLASMFGWQINLIAIQKGIDARRRSAFFVGMGAAVADVIFIYLYFTGAGLVLSHRESWAIFKWIGILTIFAIALRLLLKKQPPLDFAAKKKTGAKRYFIVGLVVVLTNPAVFLMWVGVMSFLLTHFPYIVERKAEWIFLGGFLAGAAAWFLILTFQMSRIMKNLTNVGHLAWIRRTIALGLLVAAVFLIFQEF